MTFFLLLISLCSTITFDCQHLEFAVAFTFEEMLEVQSDSLNSVHSLLHFTDSHT